MGDPQSANTKRSSAAVNAIFVAFAVATAAAFTVMTTSRPGVVRIALTVVIWVGLALMARARLMRRRR